MPNSASQVQEVITFLHERVLSNPASKVLVFGHFHVVLDAIEEALKAAAQAVPYVRIDGTTSSAQRQAAVEAFQKVGVGSCTVAKRVVHGQPGPCSWVGVCEQLIAWASVFFVACD